MDHHQNLHGSGLTGKRGGRGLSGFGRIPDREASAV